MSEIEFEQVSVTIDGKLILDSFSNKFAEKSIALVGANGSGKSTLARLINGLVLPTSGIVRVSGMDVARNPKAVRSRVGFIFTNPHAQVVMPTVIEDVVLSLRKKIADRAERNATALQILERYGLGELANQSVHELSGGQLQLLAIAGVLATEPEVLVADEPTTLLDLANSQRIGSMLLDLEQQLILATHDLELAARCERTLVLHQGRIVFDGDSVDGVNFYRELASR